MNGDLETFVPLEFQRRGVRDRPPGHDTAFLEGLGRAFYCRCSSTRGW